MQYVQPDPESCIAYLIRHGATDNNIAHPPRLQGRGVDLGLSDQGHGQAERAARFLAEQPIAAVYSSPLLRAMETAEQIARCHQLSVIPIEALCEVDVGRWEGRSWEEIARTEPEAHRRFMEDAAEFGYPEGENMDEVLARVAPAFQHVFEAHLGEQVVVVGHNVVNRVFLAHVLGVPLAKARRVSHHNCGISILRYRDRDGVRLLTLNATFHLGDQIS